MTTDQRSAVLQAPGFADMERRSESMRRKRPDQRATIRFDATGGDRRSGYARRSTDEGLREIDFE